MNDNDARKQYLAASQKPSTSNHSVNKQIRDAQMSGGMSKKRQVWLAIVAKIREADEIGGVTL